jgi:hypothetical protein
MAEQLHEAIAELISESDCGLYEAVGVLEAVKHEVLLASLAGDEDGEEEGEEEGE